MRYPLKFLQRAGLVSTMLIGGALGGLMAPLPSDAFTEPTVRLQIDTETDTLLTLTRQTGAACPSTYKLCYLLPTSTNTQYTTNLYSGAAGTASSKRHYLMKNSTNLTGRVLVRDNAGQDEVILTGMQFVPVELDWGGALNGAPCTTGMTDAQCAVAAGEFHDIRLIVTHTLDFTPNATGIVSNPALPSDNPYLAVLGTGGYFTAGPLTSATSTAANNWVKWTGRGTFKTANLGGPGEVDMLNVASNGDTTNLAPLSFQMAKNATSSASTSFRLDFLAPSAGTYPRFACSNGAVTPQCTPNVIQTLSIRLYGPDSFTSTSSNENILGNCKFVIAERDDFDDLEPIAPALQAILQNIDNEPDDPTCKRAKRIKKTVAKHRFKDAKAAAAVGAEPGTPCVAPCAPTPDSPHYYAVISAIGFTWEDARLAAEALDGEGGSWHLATITSAAEQAIIVDRITTLYGPPPISGTFQYWVGGFQAAQAITPGGNWQWINNEGSFVYSNWGSGQPPLDEPNDCCVTAGVENGEQNHLALDNRYDLPRGWGWDDNDNYLGGTILGYVAEGTTPLPTID